VADYGLEDLYDEALSLEIVKHYRGSTEGLELIQNHIYPPYKEIDLAKRVEVGLFQNSSYLDPRKFKLYLGSVSLERSAFEHFNPTTSQLDLFCSVAYQLGRTCTGRVRCCKGHQDDHVEWRRLLKEAVAIGAHQCAFQHQISPFCAFIQGMLLADESQDYTVALRTWILELQAAGIDILEYGEQEKWLRASSRKWINYILVPNCLRCRGYEYDLEHDGLTCFVCGARPIRIISFTFGARSVDWQIRWAPCGDEPAKEFWDTVKNGSDDEMELRVPGGWLEDGYDENQYQMSIWDYFEADRLCGTCQSKLARILQQS
jgi:hypothetical protein